MMRRWIVVDDQGWIGRRCFTKDGAQKVCDSRPEYWHIVRTKWNGKP